MEESSGDRPVSEAAGGTDAGHSPGLCQNERGKCKKLFRLCAPEVLSRCLTGHSDAVDGNGGFRGSRALPPNHLMTTTCQVLHVSQS